MFPPVSKLVHVLEAIVAGAGVALVTAVLRPIMAAGFVGVLTVQQVTQVLILNLKVKDIATICNGLQVERL